MRTAPIASTTSFTSAAPVDILSDDEDEICPLCCEKLDLTDKNFFPCPCGYQVCLYCWNHIKSNLNGLCPACRSPYRDNPHDFAPVDREELMRKKQEMKEKKRRDRQERKERAGKEVMHEEAKALVAAHTGDRSVLRNQRVVQRNLVYVIGLAPSIASEETLKRGEYFGQYGRIIKIAVNRTPPMGAELAAKGGQASASAYVTFAMKDDALAAIHAVDNFTFDGRLIRASFGTTKYCNTYIRGGTCTNPDCLFLHEPGNKDDTVTKEEIQAWQTKGLPGAVDLSLKVIVGGGGPSGTGRRPAHPIFPPPRFNPPTRAIPTGIKPPTTQGGAAWQTVVGLPPSALPTRSSSDMLPISSSSVFMSPLPKDSAVAALASPPAVTRAHSTSSSFTSIPSPLTSGARPGLAQASTTSISSSSSSTSTVNGPNRISPPVVGGGGGNINRKGAIVGPSAASSSLSNSTTPAAPSPLSTAGSSSSINPIKPPPGMESLMVSTASRGLPPTSTPTKPKGGTHSQQQDNMPSLSHPPLRVPPPPGVTLDSLLSSPSLVPPSTASPLLSAGLTSSMATRPPTAFPTAPPPPQTPAMMESTSPWATPAQPQQDVFAGSLLGADLGPTPAESMLKQASMPLSSGTVTLGGGGGGGGGGGALLGGGGGGGISSRASTSTDLFGSSSSSSAPLLEPQTTGSKLLSVPPPPSSSLTTTSYLGGVSGGSSTTTSSNHHNSSSSNNTDSVLMGAGGLFSTIWGPEAPPAPAPFPSWDQLSTNSSGGGGGGMQVADASSSSSSQNGGGGNSALGGSLFPFQLLPTVDGGARGPPGSASAAADADPFTLSESLARAIGMTLPDAPDSLAAQAAKGRYVKKSASRYSFANDDDNGDDGGGGGGLAGIGGRRLDASPPPRAAPHKQAPLSGLGPQPVPPSSSQSSASSILGRGMMFGNVGQGVGMDSHNGTAGPANRSLDPSLQTGMAMLQQLLPNVNLTYGDHIPEECWTTGPSGYASSSGGTGAFGGPGEGGTGSGSGGGGATAGSSSSVWSTQLRTSFPL